MREKGRASAPATREDDKDRLFGSRVAPVDRHQVANFRGNEPLREKQDDASRVNHADAPGWIEPNTLGLGDAGNATRERRFEGEGFRFTRRRTNAQHAAGLVEEEQ